MPTVRLCDVHFHRCDLTARIPFRYGMASMTAVPHLLVDAVVEVDGRPQKGRSADSLPPKWFTKHPQTDYEKDDVPAMLEVVTRAREHSLALGTRESFFDWWWELYQSQASWAQQSGSPSLLAHFGTSLLERAALDAFCRQTGLTLHAALRENALSIDLAAMRPHLGPLTPGDVLPSQPLAHLHVRHTVGLGDPIGNQDRAERDCPPDGLPFTLTENVERYGLRFFKIKLCGDAPRDRSRLLQIAATLAGPTPDPIQITLDGNETYRSMAAFREAWECFQEIEPLRDFFSQSLLFVEQPVHRDQALAPEVAETLTDWANHPPLIIDESDGDLQALPAALALGYQGTSHKNCKGIIKSILAKATLQQTPGATILSAEDLVNVGPLALLQDLAMVSALGIPHGERNGHHYFAGLAGFPEDVQRVLVQDHEELFIPHDGHARLRINGGQLTLRSVNRAGFGLAPLLDLSLFPRWEF